MPTLSASGTNRPRLPYLSGLMRVIGADSPLRSDLPASPDRTPCGAAQDGGAKKKKKNNHEKSRKRLKPFPRPSSSFELCAPEAAFERHLQFCSTLPAERWFSATPVEKDEVGVTSPLGFGAQFRDATAAAEAEVSTHPFVPVRRDDVAFLDVNHLKQGRR